MSSPAQQRSACTVHGRILWQFRDYVESRFGSGHWDHVLKTAGLADRVYLSQAYPAAEAQALFAAVERLSGKSEESVSAQHNRCMNDGADHCEIVYSVE